MLRKKNRPVLLIGLVLVAVALTGCSMKLGGGSSDSSPTSSPSASATPSPSATVKTAVEKQPTVKDAEATATLDESLWGHLTWKYPTRYTDLVTKYYGADGVQKLKKDTFPVFVVGSNLPGKVWTDSVRPPLEHKSMEDVKAHILTEPDYGWHVCSGLAHSSITGGKSLLELNPWLKECDDPSKINDWAQAAMDGNPADQLIAAKKLALVVMLLEQLNHEKVETLGTTFNYHLVVGEPNAAMTVNPKDPENTVKEFELSPVQYVGEFVTVQLTFKGQTGCWLKVGFNTGDGRFAGFACETPAPPTTTPGCTSNCGGTPGCTSNCGGHPGCTVNCNPNPCPPGNAIPDCAPKSHNPIDWTNPIDKSKATLTTPPEVTPSPVTKTQTGGGGVTDTSTNKSGSETGTTSPGADPAPTTKATPPPNEGGDN